MTKNINIEQNFHNIPNNIRLVIALLMNGGYEAYLVGGCVRDHLINRSVSDYDITTNATPEQIQNIFPRTFYENNFGTVGVVTCDINETDPQIIKDNIVEVTTYRSESDYKDKRHPENVSYIDNIGEDLKRRDFTINAMAYNPITLDFIDNFDGIKDISIGQIKCVGNPDERFNEDALRILRAVRFAAQLDWSISQETLQSIKDNHFLLKSVSYERIRDEFSKIIMTKNPMKAIITMHELNILQYISPELEKGIGVTQNHAHKYDVWEHNLRTLQHCADKGWPLELRLSALFHDISKPETRRFSKDKGTYTFYGHDVVGGRVSREILERLKYPKEIIDYVSDMVRWHMFFSDTEQVSLSAVRRLISNIGKERIWDLVNLRICDRVGTGRPKEEPYRFRKYQSMIEQAMTDPVSLKQMKINGEKIMSVTQETAGPRIGLILNALFSEILENPEKNNEEYLQKRTKELVSQETKELIELANKGKIDMKNKNEELIQNIRKDFGVK